MKKIFSFAFMFACSLGLVAQVPQLPEILQEKINQEHLDLTVDYEDGTENENSEENYYRFIERTLGNDTLMGYQWNRETEEWVPRARIVKIYNDDEQVTGKYFQIYVHRDSTWREGLYFQYDYNTSGDLTELLIQYWNPDSAVWVNHFKKTNNYDDAGNLTEILTQWWSVRKNEWVDHQQKLLTWNDGLLVADTVKIHRFMSDGWMNHHYSAYSYNDAGVKTTRTFYIWKHHDGNWKKVRRFNYNYDSSTGDLANVVSQKWRGDDIGWKDQYRFNYTYDDDGNVTVYLFEFWNYYKEEWTEKVKIDYEYDDQGLMVHFVRQQMNFFLDDWMNVKQASFQYDDDGNMTEKIVQFWDRHNEEWVNYRKWEMILQYKMLSGISDVEKTDVRAVFANPYRPGDPISFAGLESGTYGLQLFDINGRLLETRTVEQRSQTAFTTDLRNGLYIMMLSDNSRVLFHSKLLIAR